MKKNSEFESILDECLERLAEGETLEQCLQSYPEQAAQLEPLLRMAQEVRRVSAISPRSEFKARARYEFRSEVQAVTKKRVPLFGLRPRWAMVAMIISILLLSGGGTALAANDSMPDSPLYPVKLATEQVQLTLTPSDMGKARVCAMLADRRVAEIIYMAGKGDAREVDVLTQRLDKRLALLVMLASGREMGGMLRGGRGAPEAAPEAAGAPRGGKGAVVGDGNRAELRMMVGHYAVNHPAALRAVLGQAPESARPGLRRAIAISEAGYDRALEALD